MDPGSAAKGLPRAFEGPPQAASRSRGLVEARDRGLELRPTR